MLHGIGVYRWSDGKVYRGEYRNDKKEGFGIYSLHDGRQYEGWWLDGKQHGLGTMLYVDSKTGNIKAKRGLWEDGKRIRWLDSENSRGQIEEIVEYRTMFTQERNRQQ